MAKNSRKITKKRINIPYDYKSKNKIRYDKNIEVLKKLYEMKDKKSFDILNDEITINLLNDMNNQKNPEIAINEAIDKVSKEQEYLHNWINNKRFKRTRKRTLAKYKKNKENEQNNNEQKTNVEYSKYMNFVMGNNKNTTDTEEKEHLSFIEAARKEMAKNQPNEEFFKNDSNDNDINTDLEEIVVDLDEVDNYVKGIEKPVYTAFDSIKTREKSIRHYEGAKVKFDGVYKIVCDGQTMYSLPIDDELLYDDFNNKNLKNNTNIVKMLEMFDKEKNSDLAIRYNNGELPVEYNLHLFEQLKEDEYTTKQIKKIAKLDAKNNENVTIYEKKRINKFKAGLTGVVAAGLVLFGGLGLNYKLNKNRQSIKNTQIETITEDVSIEESTENYSQVTENKKEEPVIILESNMDNKSESTTEVISKTVEVNEVKEEKKETKIETKKETESVKETKEVVKTDEEEKIEEDNSLRIGDSYKLENTDLYYSSTDENPRGNTKDLNNYDYKAGIIAVVYKNQVLEIINNDSISLTELDKVCKEKYGDDIKLFVNFDLTDSEGNVITEHIGWVDSKDINGKSKVLKR